MSVARRGAFQALLVVLSAALSASATAGPPALCDRGTFVVEGSPLLSGDGAVTPDTVALADGALLFGGAYAADVRFRATAKGTRLHARFGDRKPRVLPPPQFLLALRLGCFGFPTVVGWPCSPPIRIRAEITPDCATMRGTIRGGLGHLDRDFVATAADCDEACSGDTFCQRVRGSCDSPGLCAARPVGACRAYDAPVCGCDGVTYANPCEAQAHDASLAHYGACQDECGTIAGIPCGAGEYCELPPDTCHTADVGGTCAPIPENCTQEKAPVCGCDGVTYPNDCARAQAQVTKAHDGRCTR